MMASMPEVERPSRLGITLLYFTTTVGVIGTLMTTGWPGQLAGRLNRDQSAAFMLAMVLGAAMFLVSLIVLGSIALTMYQKQPRRAAHACIGAVAVLVTAATMYGLGVLEKPGYEAGFAKWVDRHVQTDPILAWHASLPPSSITNIPPAHTFDPPNPGEIPAANWPAEIRAVAPLRVTQLSNGIMLEWGRFGTWGDCRRAFISTDDVDPSSIAPYHFSFRQLRLGLWSSVQASG